MAMTLSIRQLPADGTATRADRRLPGDPGRPLTTSGGSSRLARLGLGTSLAIWLTLPFLPLIVWSAADTWRFPSLLPTDWGVAGLSSAISQGGLAALGTSVGLGIVVAAIATPLGAILGRALAFGWAPMPRTLSAVLFAPILLPPFAGALGMNVLLLRAQIPALAGLVLVVMAMPYTVFSMRAAYAAHDLGYEEEARTLGATQAHVLWRVQVPLLAPALARSAFLAFLVAWSDYIVTVMIGGGQIITLPLIAASAASGVGNDAMVAVLSLAALVPPLALLLLLARDRRPTKGAP
ncbi:ABC transporter permease [Microbacterium sp. NPDC078428]|uniref:ABC transporter permease n=1 Tax=Microbacterium sp. NPDC078428 TaxID=3364190 RepID=UPI0037C7DB51